MLRNKIRKNLNQNVELGSRIIDFPTKWTARVGNKKSGEPRCSNDKDLKLKDPAEDWELKLNAQQEQQNL